MFWSRHSVPDCRSTNGNLRGWVLLAQVEKTSHRTATKDILFYCVIWHLVLPSCVTKHLWGICRMWCLWTERTCFLERPLEGTCYTTILKPSRPYWNFRLLTCRKRKKHYVTDFRNVLLLHRLEFNIYVDCTIIIIIIIRVLFVLFVFRFCVLLMSSIICVCMYCCFCCWPSGCWLNTLIK
jgi:hypothetical protein